MTLDLDNSHLFFAYHIRSACLSFETALLEVIQCKDISPQQFYILRCDWNSSETAFDDLKAHSILSMEEATQAVNELVAKNYISKGSRDGFYSLSSLGETLRDQLLAEYRVQISKATEGLPDKIIETALSALLTLQNNLQ